MVESDSPTCSERSGSVSQPVARSSRSTSVMPGSVGNPTQQVAAYLGSARESAERAERVAPPPTVEPDPGHAGEGSRRPSVSDTGGACRRTRTVRCRRHRRRADRPGHRLAARRSRAERDGHRPGPGQRRLACRCGHARPGQRGHVRRGRPCSGSRWSHCTATRTSSPSWRRRAATMSGCGGRAPCIAATDAGDRGMLVELHAFQHQARARLDDADLARVPGTRADVEPGRAMRPAGRERPLGRQPRGSRRPCSPRRRRAGRGCCAPAPPGCPWSTAARRV